MLHCLIPKRARPPLVTLAVQVDFGWRLEFEVLDTKIEEMSYRAMMCA
ncbi:hypothetical protein CI41S_20950 [Bradyrhizobium ivorense]|nr:hypothetical protein CI41S_20950 [Bradyrhizobium ivorense]